MAKVLEGKLAVITGAGRGIGAAIAKNLASKGANIALGYVNESTLAETQATAQLLEKEFGIKTSLAEADISVPDGGRKLIAQVKKDWTRDGKFQIDILINNAGVAINNKLPDIKVEEFDTTFKINVRGPLLVMQAAQPYLPKDRSGRVVNLASISSPCGFIGQSCYGGSKGAIEAMTRTWARELSENATVNAISPSGVEGPMYASNSDEFKAAIRGWVLHSPLMPVREGIDAPDVVAYGRKEGGRPAYVHEVAGVAGMLCTPDASWVTGQIVSANGGMVMSR